jgi:hypothetical protein
MTTRHLQTVSPPATSTSTSTDVSSTDVSRSLRRGATLAVMAMLGWFATTNSVSLYPLNDLARQGSPWASTLAGFVPFSLTLLTIWLLPRDRWLVAGWAVHAWVWVALQVWTWWVPYLAGGHREHWAEYTDTWTLLPMVGGRPGPDVQHLVLEILSVVAAVTLTRLAWQTWTDATLGDRRTDGAGTEVGR